MHLLARGVSLTDSAYDAGFAIRPPYTHFPGDARYYAFGAYQGKLADIIRAVSPSGARSLPVALPPVRF